MAKEGHGISTRWFDQLRVQTTNTKTAAGVLWSDGDVLVSGVCCAQVRVYELGQLGMKFERHLDAEVVDFQVRTRPAPRHAQAPCCLLAIL
jgi:hypothetical protein